MPPHLFTPVHRALALFFQSREAGGESIPVVGEQRPVNGLEALGGRGVHTYVQLSHRRQLWGGRAGRVQKCGEDQVFTLTCSWPGHQGHLHNIFVWRAGRRHLPHYPHTCLILSGN